MNRITIVHTHVQKPQDQCLLKLLKEFWGEILQKILFHLPENSGRDSYEQLWKNPLRNLQNSLVIPEELAAKIHTWNFYEQLWRSPWRYFQENS